MRRATEDGRPPFDRQGAIGDRTKCGQAATRLARCEAPSELLLRRHSGEPAAKADVEPTQWLCAAIAGRGGVTQLAGANAGLRNSR